jgi:hypothetical protein
MKQPKTRIPKPWEQTEWPQQGDPSLEVTYTAVGRALSAWEVFEGHLSLLFAILVAPSGDSLPARRAYNAVRTFEGRLAMLRAAADIRLHVTTDKTAKALFDDIVKSGAQYCAPERNRAWHGIAILPP